MELPIEIWLSLLTLLDSASLAAFSQCSKFYYRIVSDQQLWSKRFDLYFSLECVLKTENVDWKKEFEREFTARQSWKTDSQPHEQLYTGSPAVILSRSSCGRVTQVIEDVPNYPKYKIAMYEEQIEYDYDRDMHEMFEIKIVVPTHKYSIFPSDDSKFVFLTIRAHGGNLQVQTKSAKF